MERGKQRLEAGKADAALADFEAAMTYPENLGVGRAANPEEAEALFWKGTALAALGRVDEANAAWKAGAEGREGSATQNEYVKRCGEKG
jgi:tetratricopeptide (TPR) repeat protein